MRTKSSMTPIFCYVSFIISFYFYYYHLYENTVTLSSTRIRGKESRRWYLSASLSSDWQYSSFGALGNMSYGQMPMSIGLFFFFNFFFNFFFFFFQAGMQGEWSCVCPGFPKEEAHISSAVMPHSRPCYSPPAVLEWCVGHDSLPRGQGSAKRIPFTPAY